MSIIETAVTIPANLEANVFGQFDQHVKRIEKTLHVTIISREGNIKVLGNEYASRKAAQIIESLTTLAKAGNTITEQNVDYVLALAMEDQESAIVEIDKDCICHTINGKQIKPKILMVLLIIVLPQTSGLLQVMLLVNCEKFLILIN